MKMKKNLFQSLKMKNKKAEEVIKRLEEENKTYTIQIVGDKKNKSNGFYILMTTQAMSCGPNETFGPIKKSTLALLKEAEIKFKILK